MVVMELLTTRIEINTDDGDGGIDLVNNWTAGCKWTVGTVFTVIMVAA
jgi:hypothetical protein